MSEMCDNCRKMQRGLEKIDEERNEQRIRAENAEAERDRLREALEWYADEDNHSIPKSYICMMYEADKGKRARDALKGGE